MVGGKGASLGKMVKADFPVPPGFAITTDGYAEFIRANKLDEVVNNALKDIDYANLDQVEKQTGKIREAIIKGSIPVSLSGEIVKAYSKLGDKPYVAVRSSGTAEDLVGASFAGQYETFLDVCGEESLLESIRKCWASMWTSRVTTYRHNNGLEKAATGIAVVVQMMVDAEVAGVMFVGNPMNARADEIVINASWGLGETVVSGSVTPDEYIIGRDPRVKRYSLGSKELRVTKDIKAGKGTTKEHVPAILRERFTLTDEETVKLAELGRKVKDYYGGLPQDIEWAWSKGKFYLLQSRPVTGVDFTWEEDLDLWPSLPEEEDRIWTRTWADEVWTGPITPLMWSIRGTWMRDGGTVNFRAFGMGELGNLRLYKYSRGTVYYNTRADELIAEYCLPPSLREPLLINLHPSQIEKVMNAPFDLGRTLKMYLMIEKDHPTMGIGVFIPNQPGLTREQVREMRRHRVKTAEFLTEEQLRSLTDTELRDKIWEYNYVFAAGLAMGAWGRIFIYPPVIRTVLKGVLKYWYTGSNKNAFIEILSGLPWRTEQFYDDYGIWKLANIVRNSEKLTALLYKFEGAMFFEELKKHEEGNVFLSEYDKFLELNFYRGHADRDMYFPRRIEDPGLDYIAIRLLATADNLEDPMERADKLNQRREAAIAEVIENLAQQPLGDLKVPIFKWLLNYSMRFFSGRDDSRPVSDIVTWQKKLPIRELGRRTVERGLLEGERDFYFLSLLELCDLLAGTLSKELARAKVAGRRKAFDRFVNHEEDPPTFLQGYFPLDSGQVTGVVSGTVHKGIGTSPGTVMARAKIIPTQQDIGRLEKGDILVCHGTDPGWASAFSIVSGVVAQTGGMLAHFSCLSREYGLPAVSLPHAMKLIKDGSTITVDGDKGEVRL